MSRRIRRAAAIVFVAASIWIGWSLYDGLGAVTLAADNDYVDSVTAYQTKATTSAFKAAESFQHTADLFAAIAAANPTNGRDARAAREMAAAADKSLARAYAPMGPDAAAQAAAQAASEARYRFPVFEDAAKREGVAIVVLAVVLAVVLVLVPVPRRNAN